MKQSQKKTEESLCSLNGPNTTLIRLAIAQAPVFKRGNTSILLMCPIHVTSPKHIFHSNSQTLGIRCFGEHD